MAGGPGSYVLGAEERKEVLDVLDGGNLFRYGTPGVDGFQAKVVTFENEMAERLGHKHVVATSSGTGSLMCCLAALGIGMGDEVIVPGYTFIASIATIAMMNAIPVLAEIDESLTIDPTKIEALITPKTKAIMPVHMLGNPCDMDPIMEIAKKHNLYVIEDCCQAVGAAYHGKRVGTIGDMGAYSLNVFKTITTGDGGFVGTSSDELYERAFGFHDQGHKPCRMGVEVGLGFRKINDEKECATLLTLLFDTKELADKFCAAMGTAPIAKSGWHVYNNMEQILDKKTWTDNHPFHLSDRTYEKHMLPQTDDILDRAVNISIGVVDKGLGSGCGININSTEEEINATAKHIREVIAGL